jgi:hypothetical protein
MTKRVIGEWYCPSHSVKRKSYAWCAFFLKLFLIAERLIA